jgi:hypothetical protein
MASSSSAAGGEDAVGQLGAQHAEDLLGRVELRAVGGQRERGDVLRPGDAGAVRAGAVQGQGDALAGGFPPERLEEAPEPLLGDAGRQQEEAPPGRRFHRGVQPQPLVAVVDQPRRAHPARAPAPAQPHPQAEPPLVKGPDPRGARCGRARRETRP